LQPDSFAIHRPEMRPRMKGGTFAMSPGQVGTEDIDGLTRHSSPPFLPNLKSRLSLKCGVAKNMTATASHPAQAVPETMTITAILREMAFRNIFCFIESSVNQRLTGGASNLVATCNLRLSWPSTSFQRDDGVLFKPYCRTGIGFLPPK